MAENLEHEGDDELARLSALFIEPASFIFAVQQVYGDKVRAETKAAYDSLIDAHLLLTGVLASVAKRSHDTKTPYDDRASQRDALLATFVIGISTCESAIEEGRYLQAHALIRQELELLAQMKAVQSGTARDGKTPQVTPLDESLRRLYGNLSGAAHLSHGYIVRQATEFAGADEPSLSDTRYTRFFPQFDRDLARRSFSLHLYIMLRLIEDLSEHPGPSALYKLTDDECEALMRAVSLMSAEGMIEVDQDVSDVNRGSSSLA